jgi:hypothetical protein
MRIDQGAEHAPDSAVAIDRTPTTRPSEWRSPKVDRENEIGITDESPTGNHLTRSRDLRRGGQGQIAVVLLLALPAILGAFVMTLDYTC